MQPLVAVKPPRRYPTDQILAASTAAQEEVKEKIRMAGVQSANRQRGYFVWIVFGIVATAITFFYLGRRFAPTRDG